MSGGDTRREVRRRKFVAAYLKNPNGRLAAIAAGFSEVTASERSTSLLKMQEVRDEIEEGLTAAAHDAGVSKVWVLTKLREIVERCMEGRKVLDNKGNPTGEWKFDASGANRALELIGKHLRTWGDDSDSAAARLGNAVVRVLAQEAQAGRIGPAHTREAPHIDTSAVSESGPNGPAQAKTGPIPENGNPQAPQSALPGIDQPSKDTLSPPPSPFI